MENKNIQVGWTEEQWNTVKQAVAEVTKNGGVAGSFLPCYGPLERSAEVVRREHLVEAKTQPPPYEPLRVDDVDVHKLWTLTVHVELKQQQLAEKNLAGALLAFRRGANLIARAEDAIVFNGLPNQNPTPEELNAIGVPWQCRVTGGEHAHGLVEEGMSLPPDGIGSNGDIPPPHEQNLVRAVAGAISALESDGHLGPFACVLGNSAFVVAHTPDHGSMVMPSDRIEPMLGMPLLRSGTMPLFDSIVVSLAGNPIDLVVATAPTVQFLHVNDAARYIFRVYERFVLRVKEHHAVCWFKLSGP